jgi:hypothetical protein
LYMIQLLFSLRYQTQVRRTSPELYESLERSITDSIESSGGVLGLEHRCIVASFDEGAVGFWLDMLSLMEGIYRSLEAASPELYGFVCLLAPDLDNYGISLSHAFPQGGTGIWCSSRVRRALSAYVDFEPVPVGELPSLPQAADFARIREFNFLREVPLREAPVREGQFDGSLLAKAGRAVPKSAPPEERFFPYRERILRLLRQGNPRSVAIQGPRFVGKRDGLRRYCAELSPGLSPLAITFGAGGRGLCCIADALTPEIRGIIAASGGVGEGGNHHDSNRDDSNRLTELSELAEFVFRERFQEQYPAYVIQKTRHFFELLLELYGLAAGERGAQPILILENLNEAEAGAAEIIITILSLKRWKNSFFIYGTWSEERDNQILFESNRSLPREAWKEIFSRMVQISVEEGPPVPAVRDLSPDLREIAYALALFRRHYPSFLLPALFKEAGINPRLFSRALEMLKTLGAIDSIEDPQIRIPGFIASVEEALGTRKGQIPALVCTRLLAWEKEGRFRPCYRLLEAITLLGCQAGSSEEGSLSEKAEQLRDPLILEALRGDVTNNTFQGIEEAIRKNHFLQGKNFTQVVGEKRAGLLQYIFNTFKALNHEGEDAIREAFLQPPPDAEAFPVYQAQIYANFAAYHFGFHNIADAEEMVKQTMLLSQNQREGGGLSQAYRLFSLVSIARQRLTDAVDYLAFAVENCEGSNVQDELAVTAYYAAGTQFLFGNISQAERFVRQADQAASAAGRLEWADRARFLQGRLRFETGRYPEARAIFEALAGQEISRPGRAATLAAWIYRADIYLDEKNPRRPEEPNLDGRFFEIEAAWLRNDYGQAVSLADKLYGALPDSRFIFIEQPDWWSGFAQCEFLLFQPRDFFTRLISSYRALALCRMSLSSAAAGAEALESMRRVIREEGLPHTDPNDAFYYYAHYCVLQETGAVEVDMNTAVSMAFKRLQSRASRIDDTETKRAYLSENRWNGALSQAARRHNLI